MATGDPCTRLSRLALKQELESKPKRAPRGARPIVRVDASAVKTFKQSQELAVSPNQKRTRCEPFDVVEIESTDRSAATSV